MNHSLIHACMGRRPLYCVLFWLSGFPRVAYCCCTTHLIILSSLPHSCKNYPQKTRQDISAHSTSDFKVHSPAMSLIRLIVNSDRVQKPYSVPTSVCQVPAVFTELRAEDGVSCGSTHKLKLNLRPGHWYSPVTTHTHTHTHELLSGLIRRNNTSHVFAQRLLMRTVQLASVTERENNNKTARWKKETWTQFDGKAEKWQKNI